jgi:ribosomal protein S18 acetylase RimI-like enzyme
MEKIRSFRPADVESIVGFKKMSVGKNFPESGFDEGVFRTVLLGAARKNPDCIRVLEADGKAVGYVWLKVMRTSVGTFGRVQHVFVEDKFRKRGLGKKLMESAEEYLRSRGIKKMKLSVTATNETALSFYEELGYKVKRFVMEKDL